jgi:uncharacterized membrane protein
VAAPAPVAAPASVTAPPPLRPAPPPVVAPEAPRPAPRRPSRTAQEWEAMVGENWLNKAGALVVVIGIALFLAYSVTQFGPVGRVAMALAVSVAMIAGGVVLERRQKYTMFARGLLGGGWAALYFTAYAMYALDAARVINDPLTGAIVLVLVAVGMIAHSLRYRSQVVTGLAYFAGFASLAITPVAAFSVIAVLPLAASLLYIAYRFEWFDIALFGLLATYGTAAAKATGTATVFQSQSIVAMYWLLFEAFDVLRAAKGHPAIGAARWVFPLNAVAALGMSHTKWASAAPSQMSTLYCAAAAAYLGEALLRARLRVDRALSGYRGAITLAAALGAVVLGLEVKPEFLGIAWMLYAAALFELGFWTGLAEFRWQGYAGSALASATLVGFNAFSRGRYPLVSLGGAALICYLITAQVLRTARIPERQRDLAHNAYSLAGTFFTAVLVWHVVPRDWLGVGWLALGLVLFEASVEFEVSWFCTQGIAAGALGIGTLAVCNVLGIGGAPVQQWGPLLAASGLCYLGAARMNSVACHPRMPAGTLSAGNLFLAAMLWYLLPGPLVAVSWAALTLLNMELSLWRPAPGLRMNAHLLAAATFGRLFIANFTITGQSFGISHRLLTVLPFAAACYYLYGVTAAVRDRFARFYLYAGTILAVALIRFEVGRTMAVVGWALYGLALLYFGVRRDLPDLRWQSYALALWTFVRSWNTNFYAPESLLGVPVRIVTGAIVIASFYVGEFLSPRLSRNRIEANARTVFSVLATTLLTVLIYYEVSGGLLTVAWGMEGIALLLAGFATRERSLRLAGLGLFLFCVLKLFLYDLRQLDTLYRILSFIVLGVLLLGASWIYTRFREQLKQYL